LRIGAVPGRRAPDEGCARSTTLSSVQLVISDFAADTAWTMPARLFGLPKETVIAIVPVKLPMVAKMADENPARLKALYAQPVTLLPEPRQEFSTGLTENPEARQHMVDAFQAVAGPMLSSLDRDTACEAGTTLDVGGKAAATTHRATARAVGKENLE